MEVTKEIIEENKVKLDVEIDKDKVDQALNKAYRSIVKDVNIPGFRKGKVPRKVLEKKYGKEVLYKDALDVLIPQTYPEAIEEVGIEPIAQPEITDVFIEDGKAATFTAEVEVKPDVELGEYTGLDIQKDEVEVTDEEIEEKLEAKRGQHAELVNVDRDQVEEGDYTLIDFEGSVDGEVFEGGTAEDYNLEIGSGQFIPGFEEQLVGAKVGEEVEVNVTFPEEYQAEDLAGKDALFKVTVNEIKEKELPELDDEFAKDLKFDTLEDLKDDIKDKLLKSKEEGIQREYENKLVETVSENSEVNIPETMVENEIDTMINNYKMQLSQSGLDFDQYLEMSGMDEDQIRDEYKEPAQKRVKSNLVLEAIIENEGIEVGEEEVDKQVEEIAEQQGQDKEQIKAFLQMQGQLAALEDSLKMQKALEFLKENN